MKNTRERKKNFRSPFVRTKKKKLSLTLGLETNQTNTKNSYPKQKSRGSRTTRTVINRGQDFFPRSRARRNQSKPKSVTRNAEIRERILLTRVWWVASHVMPVNESLPAGNSVPLGAPG